MQTTEHNSSTGNRTPLSKVDLCSSLFDLSHLPSHFKLASDLKEAALIAKSGQVALVEPSDPLFYEADIPEKNEKGLQFTIENTSLRGNPKSNISTNLETKAETHLSRFAYKRAKTAKSELKTVQSLGDARLHFLLNEVRGWHFHLTGNPDEFFISAQHVPNQLGTLFCSDEQWLTDNAHAVRDEIEQLQTELAKPKLSGLERTKLLTSISQQRYKLNEMLPPADKIFGTPPGIYAVFNGRTYHASGGTKKGRIASVLNIKS